MTATIVALIIKYWGALVKSLEGLNLLGSLWKAGPLASIAIPAWVGKWALRIVLAVGLGFGAYLGIKSVWTSVKTGIEAGVHKQYADAKAAADAAEARRQAEINEQREARRAEAERVLKEKDAALTNTKAEVARLIAQQAQMQSSIEEAQARADAAARKTRTVVAKAKAAGCVAGFDKPTVLKLNGG